VLTSGVDPDGLGLGQNVKILGFSWTTTFSTTSGGVRVFYHFCSFGQAPIAPT